MRYIGALEIPSRLDLALPAVVASIQGFEAERLRLLAETAFQWAAKGVLCRTAARSEALYVPLHDVVRDLQHEG